MASRRNQTTTVRPVTDNVRKAPPPPSDEEDNSGYVAAVLGFVGGVAIAPVAAIASYRLGRGHSEDRVRKLKSDLSTKKRDLEATQRDRDTTEYTNRQTVQDFQKCEKEKREKDTQIELCEERIERLKSDAEADDILATQRVYEANAAVEEALEDAKSARESEKKAVSERDEARRDAEQAQSREDDVRQDCEKETEVRLQLIEQKQKIQNELKVLTERCETEESYAANAVLQANAEKDEALERAAEARKEAEAQAQALLDEFSDLTQEKDRVEDEARSCKVKAEKAAREMQQTTAQIAQKAADEVAAAETKVAEKDAKIQELTEANKAAAEASEKLTQSEEQARKEAQAQAQALQAAENKISDLTQEKDRVEDEARSCKVKAEKAAREMQQTTAQIAQKAADEMAAAETKVATKDAEIEALTDKAKNAAAEASEKLAAAEAAAKASLQAVIREKEEAEQLAEASRLAQEKANTDRIESERQKYEQQLKEVNKKVEDLETKLAAQVQEKEDAVKKVTDEAHTKQANTVQSMQQAQAASAKKKQSNKELGTKLKIVQRNLKTVKETQNQHAKAKIKTIDDTLVQYWTWAESSGLIETRTSKRINEDQQKIKKQKTDFEQWKKSINQKLQQYENNSEIQVVIKTDPALSTLYDIDTQQWYITLGGGWQPRNVDQFLNTTMGEIERHWDEVLTPKPRSARAQGRAQSDP